MWQLREEKKRCTISTVRRLSVPFMLPFRALSKEELSQALELACVIWADNCAFD